jgi:hypothetical protein
VYVKDRGIGLLGLLGIILVIAKLAGVISWSWWLVLLPFYFGLAVLLFILCGGILAAGLAFLVMAGYNLGVAGWYKLKSLWS